MSLKESNRYSSPVCVLRSLASEREREKLNSHQTVGMSRASGCLALPTVDEDEKCRRPPSRQHAALARYRSWPPFPATFSYYDSQLHR